jgi:hypothetical protein
MGRNAHRRLLRQGKLGTGFGGSTGQACERRYFLDAVGEESIVGGNCCALGGRPFDVMRCRDSLVVARSFLWYDTGCSQALLACFCKKQI